MIISASRRTDIPAFYSEWFMERIRRGYATFVNPFNANQINKVSLKREDVDVIVFWTKNPKPLMKHLDEIDRLGYKYYFQYTLNNYSKVFEPNLPPFEERIKTFKELSDRIGKEKVILRYDPIILSDITPFEFHLNSFSRIVKDLSGYTNRVVISIFDDYRGASRRLKKAGINVFENPFNHPEFREFIKSLASLAKAHDMEIYSCAEVVDLEEEGVLHGKCVDDEYIKKVFNIDVTKKKDTGQRKECGCVASKDIGVFDTCPHKCIYCYANMSEALVDKKRREHDPNSPSLVGWHDVKEKEDYEQKSFFDLL
ncbi:MULTISPECIES: DUF1848 domain-containing protein [Caloramator]|uniref:DUF1848 domain-containing protein n=1 Tax=Caloramator australicus RC3 TaxID=857293 RepID=I7J4V9_9CLOT|nr:MULTISPECIES: DUF1848 domain-containing protein [Caloramator]MDO6354880.1 DUF1848 domain-containing protein [Caloramator sp. CAR-1]CCJ33116.1 hypothetical protein CAAU_1032 [Caloramator australicus RC3]